MKKSNQIKSLFDGPEESFESTDALNQQLGIDEVQQSLYYISSNIDEMKKDSNSIFLGRDKVSRHSLQDVIKSLKKRSSESLRKGRDGSVATSPEENKVLIKAVKKLLNKMEGETSIEAEVISADNMMRLRKVAMKKGLSVDEFVNNLLNLLGCDD